MTTTNTTSLKFMNFLIEEIGLWELSMATVTIIGVLLTFLGVLLAAYPLLYYFESPATTGAKKMKKLGINAGSVVAVSGWDIDKKLTGKWWYFLATRYGLYFSFESEMAPDKIDISTEQKIPVLWRTNKPIAIQLPEKDISYLLIL